MNSLLNTSTQVVTKPSSPRTFCSPRHQHGVVLVIALILLVVISLLAATSMHNAASTESAASNVRSTELANDAADIALRYCEDHVLTVMGGSNPPTTTPTAATSPPSPIIWGPSDPAPPRWKNTAVWDSTASVAFTLPLDKVNKLGLSATYKRSPECLIETQTISGLPANVLTNTSSFVITARGFGPEILAPDATRARPEGTESWVQSHIQINPSNQ